jgi:L-lactate dehydrogenase complex protein LldE
MACHLRGLGLSSEPEQLIRRVKGVEFVAMERADECCGFGGSFSVRYPGISGAMVLDKATLIEQTGADAVVATDAGCLMNIAGCLRRRGSKVRALHLAELLAPT